MPVGAEGSSPIRNARPAFPPGAAPWWRRFSAGLRAEQGAYAAVSGLTTETFTR